MAGRLLCAVLRTVAPLAGATTGRTLMLGWRTMAHGVPRLSRPCVALRRTRFSWRRPPAPVMLQRCRDG
ncbi:hypothetical protein F511_44692 [Dorcoceras hygrometricum]|uniref:Uncharacterized protein n=1 Tax=Dorcoceras hygrometricum TaxID=472368 RepID=A0A2Z6ZXE3_9LAMI|nr:hypothetical protein F511_44692 [Dorcoceras hygrometricum]